MANNQDAAAEIRPFIVGDFDPGKYIHVGGNTSSPYHRGVVDLAYNHNTMLANMGHPLVDQVDTVAAIAYVATAVTWAKYVIRVPHWMERSVEVQVVATTSGGTTYQVRGSTSAGAGSYSAATASGATATFTVPVGTVGDYMLMTLQFQLSGAANFTPSKVFAYIKPIATTNIGAFSSAPTTTIMPQDVDAYGVDKPLNVLQARDLINGTQQFFKDNVRVVANWSMWYNFASLSTAAEGLRVGYDTTVNFPFPLQEIIYYPRQGVRNLRFFAAARSVGYAGSNPCKFTMNFKGHPLDTVLVTDASTVFTEASWTVWGPLVPVPPEDGPIYIQIQGYCPNAGVTPLYIQAWSIHEDGGSVS